MRFLIIGASGFVGGQIVSHLRSLNLNVIGTQSGSSNPDLTKFDLAQDRITDSVEHGFFETDESVISIISAAITDLNKCIQEKEASYLINVQRTIRLIDDLANLNATPVFISSDLVFDGKTGYYNEEHTPARVVEYGRHKEEVENHLLSHVPNSLILRLSKIVGDGQSRRDVFLEWYNLLEESKPIQCVEGQMFSPTYVGDVVKGIILAAESGLTGLYHLTNLEFFSRDELARQFAWALGKQAEIICRPQSDFGFTEERPLKTYLDSSKFVRATGMHFKSMSEVFNNFLASSASVS